MVDVINGGEGGVTCCVHMICFKTGQIRFTGVFAEGFWERKVLSGSPCSAGREQENR